MEKYIAAHPDQKEALQGLFTVVRREGDKLVTIPYSRHYTKQLEPAAAKLREAANADDQPSLKTYLTKLADAFGKDNYRDSDMAWMDLTARSKWSSDRTRSTRTRSSTTRPPSSRSSPSSTSRRPTSSPSTPSTCRTWRRTSPSPTSTRTRTAEPSRRSAWCRSSTPPATPAAACRRPPSTSRTTSSCARRRARRKCCSRT
jgi:hypothetical protein